MRDLSFAGTGRDRDDHTVWLDGHRSFYKTDITYQMTIENILNSLSLNSFKTLFTEYSMVRYALNSIIVSVISTAGQILLCAMSGFVFARIDFKHKEKIFILYLATMMIPVQATVIPQYILINKMGLVNTYVGLFLPGIFNAFGTFLMSTVFHEHPESVGRSGLPGWGRIYKDLFPDHASACKDRACSAGGHKLYGSMERLPVAIAGIIG